MADVGPSTQNFDLHGGRYYVLQIPVIGTDGAYVFESDSSVHWWLGKSKANSSVLNRARRAKYL
jgi:hypothetical protein